MYKDIGISIHLYGIEIDEKSYKVLVPQPSWIFEAI